MNGGFRDKVAIVTGATSGIGRSVALSLGERGVKVSACSRSREKLSKLHDLLGSKGIDFITFQCDVANTDDVKRLVEETINRYGRIDYLVNNAGVFPVTPSLELSEEEWDRVIDTNLKGPFICTKTVAKEMIALGIQGRVVNISSTASLIARPGVAHYASSKAGLNMLTKVLALELAPYKINVNAVLPGLIRTEGLLAQLQTEASRKEHRAKLARIPFKEEGSPRDISDAVLYLLSDQSKYVTGAALVVDGGYSLGIPAY